MRWNSHGHFLGIWVMASVLSGCMGFPPMEPDPCDALPLSSLFFRYPAIQTRAQFQACTGSENQPVMGLFTCPMLPVSPVLTAFYTWPLVPVIAMPIDLLSKLSPYTSCKAPSVGDTRKVGKPEAR